ncbi:hypothetical protein DFJ74DRAFT_656683 [Hyaloraphidium curvatum]|nr:hypothetical protein DFJ74DRAFT_656683 [Hyaloraphidium curvatum]
MEMPRPLALGRETKPVIDATRRAVNMRPSRPLPPILALCHASPSRVPILATSSLLLAPRVGNACSASWEGAQSANPPERSAWTRVAPSRPFSTHGPRKKSAMGGIFAAAEEKAGSEGDEPIAHEETDVPGRITLEDVAIPDRTLKAMKEQKLITIEPPDGMQLLRIAVDAVNSTVGDAADGRPKPEPNMLETDERIFELAAKDTRNISMLARVLARNPNAIPVTMRLYDVAISREDLDAECDVAVMLHRGIIPVPDGPQIALGRLQELALAKGHAPSQYALATIWAAVEETQRQGWDLMKKAAEAGFPDALAQMGIAHKDGRGDMVEKDVEKAVVLLEKAAELDHPHAIFVLGAILSTGADPVPKDVARAFRLFEKAAGMGLAVAQHNLAAMYQTGMKDLATGEEIAPKDEMRASEYWRMAAQQGFTPSVMNVAKLYMEGTVLPKDLAMARTLMERVAQVEGATGDEAKLGLQLLDELEKSGGEQKESKSGICSIM